MSNGLLHLIGVAWWGSGKDYSSFFFINSKVSLFKNVKLIITNYDIFYIANRTTYVQNTSTYWVNTYATDYVAVFPEC